MGVLVVGCNSLQIQVELDGNRNVASNCAPILHAGVESPRFHGSDRCSIQILRPARFRYLNFLRHSVRPNQNFKNDLALLTLTQGLDWIFWRSLSAVEKNFTGSAIRRWSLFIWMLDREGAPGLRVRGSRFSFRRWVE